MCYQKIGKSVNLRESSGDNWWWFSGGKVWRTISILPGNIFLRQNLNEEEKNNSTGVYKYISIRIPLDYIFDCIKKVYFVNLL